MSAGISIVVAVNVNSEICSACCTFLLVSIYSVFLAWGFLVKMDEVGKYEAFGGVGPLR